MTLDLIPPKGFFMTDAAELTQITRTLTLCRHFHASGRRCGSPALRGEQFCYYHHPNRRPGPLAERRAILRALNRAFQFLLDGSLPVDRADRLRERIRPASDSLPR